MKKAVISMLALMLLTSCWGLTEIEEIGFVLAVALDPLTKAELEEYNNQFKKETGQPARQMYKTTYQIVIPSMVVAEGLKIEDQAFFNMTSVGRTGFKMNRNNAARISRRFNFEHLKALIINEQLLKTGELAKFIDLYLRDHEMRRDTLVYVSKEDGKEVLKGKIPLEIIPAISIKKIHENYQAQHGMLPPKPIGELAISILDEKSFIVPRISAEKGELIIAGAALFLGDTNELIGWLGEEDVAAYRLVVGEAGNQVMEVTLEEQIFVFEFDNMAMVIDYQLKNGKDFFEIKLKAEGFFVEDWLDDIKIGEEETNKKLAAAVEKEIERLATKIVEKMQREFYSDIFELSKTLKIEKYQRWKEIKAEWDGEDGYFSKANIEINAEVKIEHQMLIEQLR